MNRAVYVLSIPKSVCTTDVLPFVETWKEKYSSEFGPLIVLIDGMHLIRLDEDELKVCKDKNELLELIKERNDKQCVESADTSQENLVQMG